MEGGHGPSAAYDSIVAWRDRRDEIAGVAFFGPQIVLAATDSGAIDAFAVEARRRPEPRMLVGPKEQADAFWARIATWHSAPRLIRDSQPLYAVDRTTLRGAFDVAVRPATLDEADLVAENSAEMMLYELEYDPREARAGFEAGVRRLIQRGWWWVWIVNGDLRFQCNIGARTAKTAQIQGVWTPPSARGHGYATQALGAICARLLRDLPTLSLYVNGFNTDAVRLYERLGFERVGEFATYLFD